MTWRHAFYVLARIYKYLHTCMSLTSSKVYLCEKINALLIKIFMKMKKLIQLVVPMALVVFGLSSCDKDDNPTPTTTTPTPTTPTAPTPPTPGISGDYYGLMAAIQMEFSYSNPQIPQPVSINSELGVASFYTNPSSIERKDAGTVKVNNEALEKQTGNSYFINATPGLTPSTLNLTSGVSWDVSGSADVAAFSFTHTGTFPDYTGTLPTSIDKSQDLEITLGSNVTNADSVLVVIVPPSGSVIMHTFASNIAKAVVPSADLNGLPGVSDNTAYLEVIPYTYEIDTKNGKRYVFVKEKAVVTGVNIN